MPLDTPATHPPTHSAVEQVVRDSYSRLLAYLAARSHDVALAEDALADALHAALETWPRTGVPAKPEAWLLTAARRRLIDHARHARVEADAVPAMLIIAEEAQQMAGTETHFPDERLKLLFICAHPAIDAAARTPLMLQTVLGLDARRIASAFLVQPAAMGQRLSRAKTKIRDARIAFELPPHAELPRRLNAVLEAIYAAYSSGWDDAAGSDTRRKDLTIEAIYLGRLLLLLLPDEPEVAGLLALMLHCEARHEARRSSAGEYVPLSEQDTALWDVAMIAEAERHLAAAAIANRPGRFQLEAAVQSIHAQRARSGVTDWEAIALMYEGLVHFAPTIGALVGRAAAIAEARGFKVGLERLEAIPADLVRSYQPYWAVRAHLMQKLDRSQESMESYNRAIGLCENEVVRQFLLRKSNAAFKHSQ